MNLKILKMIGEEILPGLYYVAKSSFKTCTFPTSHKIATVTYLFKNKESKTKIGNYRPISLLCLPEKLLKAIITSEIDSHVYLHQLLNSH